jgi:hypothetical protein
LPSVVWILRPEDCRELIINLTNKHMKTYKTYNARNAVKAAEVTNHIKARKKEGVSHEEAKAEAYRLFKIKAALPILKKQFRISFAEVEKVAYRASLPPLPPLPKLPPLPTGYNGQVLPPLPRLPQPTTTN